MESHTYEHTSLYDEFVSSLDEDLPFSLDDAVNHFVALDYGSPDIYLDDYGFATICFDEELCFNLDSEVERDQFLFFLSELVQYQVDSFAPDYGKKFTFTNCDVIFDPEPFLLLIWRDESMTNRADYMPLVELDEIVQAVKSLEQEVV